MGCCGGSSSASSGLQQKVLQQVGSKSEMTEARKEKLRNRVVPESVKKLFSGAARVVAPKQVKAEDVVAPAEVQAPAPAAAVNSSAPTGEVVVYKDQKTQRIVIEERGKSKTYLSLEDAAKVTEPGLVEKIKPLL